MSRRPSQPGRPRVEEPMITVGIGVPPAILRKLEAIAKRDALPLAATVRMLVLEALRARGAKV